MKFTREQELSIRLRDRSILVSAGAGAGKTRVLVNRMVDMILEEEHPISADSFLVMTFTNAAAAEMKERIIEELNARLEKNPENARIRRQTRMVKQADISTVHSFCNHLIRSHFNEADIDPSFRIGEEGELFLLRQQVIEDLMEEAYASGRESFLRFVEAYAPEKSDRMIEVLIEECYRFSRGFPDRRQWFAHMEQEMQQMESEDGLQNSDALKEILKKVHRVLQEMQQQLQKGMAFFTEQREPERFWNLMLEDEKIVRQLKKITTFDEIYQQMSEISFPALPRATKKEKEWTYLEDVKEIHKTVRETIQELKHTFFLYNSKQICQENKKLRPFLEELIRLTQRYEEKYFLLKKEKNIYDFDDLEHIALELLVKEYDENGKPIPSETANELSRKYKAIFVDEYQDTNLVQETLIRTIYQKGKNFLFVVGDVKQSIYRFRQARPDLFLARYQSYQEATEELLQEEEIKQDVRIELRDNFRSAPGVLSFCNVVFEALMERSFGGVDYTENIALRPGENGPMEKDEEQSEMLVLIDDEEREQLSTEISALEAETAMIARRIRELKEEGFLYKEMVILLRSSAGRAEPMAEQLTTLGIPAVCESKTGYFQTREVQLVLNYLAIIDNVYQDIPMASVLLSSIGRLTEEELASLRILTAIPVRQEYALYDLIELYLAEGEDENLRKKLSQFQEQLLYFRRKKKEISLHRLLWEIYTKTGIYYAVMMMPEGETRKENLLMLLQKAEDYEKSVFRGLFYFLRYMEQLRTYEVELGSASKEAETADVVRIMTIHKSKGLEFPVVFVSGLSKKFNFMDGNRPVLFHSKLGIGMEFVNLHTRMHHPSLMKKVIREQMLRETLEEELRILYVAMTRAQKKLIMTGIIKKEKLNETVSFPLSLEKKMSAKCFIDWILPLFPNLPVKKVHFHEFMEEWNYTQKKKENISLEEYMTRNEMQVENTPVKKTFSYVYPYREVSEWKRKYSVSELKKISMIPLEKEERQEQQEIEGFLFEKEKVQEEIPKPTFLKEDTREVTGTARGTIIHKVMEVLPFGQVKSKKDLYDEMKKIEIKYPQTSQISMKSVYWGVEKFLFSEIGEKIRKMDQEGKLLKEFPFTVGIPASMLHTSQATEKIMEEERIIVQGIVDLCGETEDGLWLIDYKTDRVNEGEERLLLDRYEKQMLYYKTALEQILHKKVKHSYIFSFSLGNYVEICWDDSEKEI